MWLQLGNKYDPSWSGRPPQLLSADNPTWQKYREKIKDKMKCLYYNVAMTIYEAPEAAKNAAQERMYLYPIAKRVDAVGFDGKKYHLFEVNRSAKLRSVGQAISYRELWNMLDTKYKQGKTDLTYIITEFVDKDVKYICENKNIKYEVV